MKTIALDLDGVVFDSENLYRVYTEIYDVEKNGKDNICINAADNGICALYFKNNASNKVDKEKVINVNNWGEIYKYLMLNEGE